jgi:replication factor C small subunit
MSHKISSEFSEAQAPLWRIKYRPKSIEEIQSYYPKISKQFLGYLKEKNIPHIMLIGPKGSGKTVLAEILARELLKEEFQINYKLLFADDPIGRKERRESRRQGYVSTRMVGSSAGITRRYRPFIQMRVKPFISMTKFGDEPFKILTIKNFHALDVEQQAFRRLMEHYSKNCRMILITDKISGIIDPIVSRCQLVLVPYMKQHLFAKFIKQVCNKEEIPIKLNAINYLRVICENNIGRALDLVQGTYFKYNFVTLEYLASMAKQMQDSSIKKLFVLTTKGNLKTVRKLLRTIVRKKMKSKTQILTDLTQIIYKLPLERTVRAKYLDLIADCDFQSIDSREEEIQLMNLFAKMNAIGHLNYQ